jgi:small subunit ribosomal protein S20
MPIIRSAKKALRQSLRRRARNIQKKESYKQVAKNIRKLAHAGQLEQAKNLIPQAYKALDKAAKTNVIKKNKASRLKSRLTKLVVAKELK